VGEVIDLFTRENIPAAKESDFVGDFIDDDHIGQLMSSIQELSEAEDEDEFKRWIRDIRHQVARWPK
jgi:hypothetical protein